MNDAQKDKMIAVLADAFDTAAMNCMLKKEAAMRICSALETAGYKIELRKKQPSGVAAQAPRAPGRSRPPRPEADQAGRTK